MHASGTRFIYLVLSFFFFVFFFQLFAVQKMEKSWQRVDDSFQCDLPTSWESFQIITPIQADEATTRGRSGSTGNLSRYRVVRLLSTLRTTITNSKATSYNPMKCISNVLGAFLFCNAVSSLDFDVNRQELRLWLSFKSFFDVDTLKRFVYYVKTMFCSRRLIIGIFGETV